MPVTVPPACAMSSSAACQCAARSQDVIDEEDPPPVENASRHLDLGRAVFERV